MRAFPHTEYLSRDRAAGLTNKQTTTTYAENISSYSVGYKTDGTAQLKQYDCSITGASFGIPDVSLEKVRRYVNRTNTENKRVESKGNAQDGTTRQNTQ